MAICSPDPSRGKRAAASIHESKSEIGFIAADLRKESQVKDLIRRTVERFGRLDVLCNNAGIQRLASIEKLSLAVWDEIMAVNARGAFLCTKYALPHLKFSKGSIVNISSTAGLTGYAGGSAYCVSKAALVMLTKTTALELAVYGIRVNCICPGATSTPLIRAAIQKRLAKQIPLSRVGERDDVAELVFFLASEKARQITGGVHVVTAALPPAGHDWREPAVGRKYAK